MACLRSTNIQLYEKFYSTIPPKYKEFANLFSLQVVGYYPATSELVVWVRNYKYQEKSELAYQSFTLTELFIDHLMDELNSHNTYLQERLS